MPVSGWGWAKFIVVAQRSAPKGELAGAAARGIHNSGGTNHLNGWWGGQMAKGLNCQMAKFQNGLGVEGAAAGVAAAKAAEIVAAMTAASVTAVAAVVTTIRTGPVMVVAVMVGAVVVGVVARVM